MVDTLQQPAPLLLRTVEPFAAATTPLVIDPAFSALKWTLLALIQDPTVTWGWFQSGLSGTS